MNAAALVRARAQAVGRARTQRERVLRPIKPLPAEVAAYSKSIRSILEEFSARVEQSLLPYLERAGALDALELEDDLADSLRAIIAILRSAFLPRILESALFAARRWSDRANARHRERFNEAIRDAIGIDVQGIVREEGLAPILKLKTQENVALIQSIPTQYLEQVERAVYQHVIHGQRGGKTLAKRIQEIGQVSAKRAKFIARDQTSKLVAAMNRERNLALGIEEYVWRTSKDERVRPNHRSKEGKTFRWDDPPEDTGHPGEDYNCRCTASPKLKL